MKNFNSYLRHSLKLSQSENILERLKLTKGSKPKGLFSPKSHKELRELIERLLNERGKDADLNDIDVSDVGTFCDTTRGLYKDRGLFEDLDPHNIDISQWNVTNITDMHRTFFGCHNFNCDLSKWDVHNGKTFSNMFYECENFTGNGLENWDVSEIESMFGMFVRCEKLNCDLSSWDIQNCKSMAHMFNGCKIFNCDLSSWNPIKVDEKYYMFEGCTILRKNKLIPKWYYD